MQQYPKHPAGDAVGTAGLQKAGRGQQPQSSRERHGIQSARGHSAWSVRCLRPPLLMASAGYREGRIQPAPHTHTLLMECPLYPPQAQEPLQPPSLQGLPKGPQQGLWALQVRWAHGTQGCRPRPGKCSKNRTATQKRQLRDCVGGAAGRSSERGQRQHGHHGRREDQQVYLGAAEGGEAENLEPWLILAQ